MFLNPGTLSSGDRIVLEPPYNNYTIGYLRIDKSCGRKYITLYSKDKQSGVTLARYLYQINLWKTEGKLIPAGYEVDHIDDDCTNDHLINLQLLTENDNLAKQRNLISRTLFVIICPICRKLGTVVCHRHGSKTGKVICCSSRCAITLNLHTIPQDIYQWIIDNQILYLIKEFNNSATLEPICEIIETFSRDIFDFDIKKIDAFKYVDFSHPKYLPVQERLPLIKERLAQGISQIDIAKEFGMESSGINRIVREYTDEPSNEEKHKAKVEIARKAFNAGKSYSEIAKLINLTESGVEQLIRKYVPEYKTKEQLLQEKIVKIGDLLSKGNTRKQIAILLNAELSGIYKFIEKFLPEYKIECM